MTMSSVPQLVETIRQRGLLNGKQLAKLTGSLQKRFRDPDSLLQDLVRRGWLTPQQVGQLMGVPASVPMGLPVPAAGVPMGVPVIPGGVPMGQAIPPPRHEQKQRSRYRWIQWNLVGLAVLGGLGWFLWHVINQQQERLINPTPDEEVADRSAEAQPQFEKLQKQFADPFANTEQLRSSLQAFRDKYPEVPQAVQAAEMAADLAGPLDGLDRNRIPPEELFAGQPKNLVAVLGERRWRHWAAARQVAFSPDGGHVASAGDDGRVHIWVRRTGAVQATLSLANVVSLNYTLDGNLLTAADSTGKATLWQVRSGQHGTVAGPAAKPTAIAISLQGQLAASAAEDASLTLWDPGSGEAKAKMMGHRSTIRAVAFAPNGQLLASGGDDALAKVWNAAGQELFTIEGNNGPIRAVAFSPDNRRLAIGGDDRDVRVFDIADLAQPKELVRMAGHEGAITALAFNGDGKVIASASDDLNVKLWDIAKEGSFVSLQGHVGKATDVAFSGNTLGTSGEDGTIRLWNLIQETRSGQENYMTGHGAAASAVAFLDIDNANQMTAASGGWDNKVKFWNLATLRERHTTEHDAPLTALAYSGVAKRLASGSSDGIVKLWDPSGAFKEVIAYPLSSPAQALAFPPDGAAFAAGTGKPDAPQSPGELRLFHTFGQGEAMPGAAAAQGITAIAFSPSGGLVYSAGHDGLIQIRGRQSGQERGSLKNDAPIDAMAASPRGKLLATFDHNRKLKLWDLEKMQERSASSAEAGYASGMAFSPDGRRLVTSHHEGKVVLWDPETGKKLDDYPFPGGVRGVAFAPDSRHIATANANGTIYVLRLLNPPSRRK